MTTRHPLNVETNRNSRTFALWDRIAQSTFQLSRAWERAGSFLPFAAAAWSVFAIIELALGVFITESAIRNHQLPLGARLLLICHTFTILALFILAISWVSVRVWRLVPARRSAQWFMGAIGGAMLWLILLLYAASWGMFWQTGSFLGRQGLLFLATNPVQVFHWVESDIAWTILAVTVGTTAIIGYWMPRWITSWPTNSRRRFVGIWSVAVATSIAGAFLGSLYSGWGDRQYSLSGIVYARSRDNAAGPFPYVMADFRDQILNQQPVSAKNGQFQIIRRPIIPMARYLDSSKNREINRWNVVLLVIESLRADQLRGYGGNRDVMPALEMLAQEGRIFVNSYSQASHTNYATLVPLSSHYPLRSLVEHVYPENPRYPRVLIYDVLKGLGYHTGIFSSSNEYWAGMINYLQTGHIDRLFHAANFKGPTYTMEGDFGLAAWVQQTKHAGSVDDRFTVDQAIDWLGSLDKNTPFFVYVNFQNSHVPYVVPRDFQRRFGPDKLDFKIRFGHFPRDKIDVVKNVYADSLSYIDAQVARLFAYLKNQGLWENTIIVVTGDHGQAFFEHGFAAHAGPLFDEVMKVPLIIRAPGVRPAVDARPAQHVDIAPSVLDLLGLPTHPSFQGMSLFAPEQVSARTLYMVTQTPLALQFGIIRSGFKLIHDERQRQYFLYNLRSDPGETTDVAQAYSAVTRDLADRLQTWRTLQIDYYSDPILQGREYPPIIAD
jgi:arylsulfatase A-like enzyme